MRITKFHVFLWIQILVSASFISAVLAQQKSKLINVREFGAKGDGVSDDTRAIQAAINAATPGTTITFPRGTYVVSNFGVKNRSGLSFVGEGKGSLIKQRSGADRIATFEASTDILITKLAFDANGIQSYGGVAFYDMKQVRIEDNLFIDSKPKPIQNTDRYSFVFGKGGSPSQDIRIINNVIEDLQLEVDHARRVLIDGNTVKRAVNTAGIGIFSVADGAIAEDYQITNNTVIDPNGAAFTVGIDPPSDRNCVFRRITIANNQVIQSKTTAFGIRIGTGDNSRQTTGNIFEDIVIKENRIRIERTAPQAEQMIFANTSDTAGIVFERLVVSGNTIENAGRPNKGYAIELRRIRNSQILNNTIKGVSNGISLSEDLVANEVSENAVEASDNAYRLEYSRGGNKAKNNRVVGKPQQPWRLSSMDTSDSIQQ